MKGKTYFEKWLTKSGFYDRNERIANKDDYKKLGKNWRTNKIK